ncbi:hypothetical protein GH733_012173 [Mirounga leonina]|nr:hypothetical protein GH733_012173 [Mirounga leonina]
MDSAPLARQGDPQREDQDPRLSPPSMLPQGLRVLSWGKALLPPAHLEGVDLHVESLLPVIMQCKMGLMPTPSGWLNKPTPLVTQQLPYYSQPQTEKQEVDRLVFVSHVVHGLAETHTPVAGGLDPIGLAGHCQLLADSLMCLIVETFSPCPNPVLLLVLAAAVVARISVTMPELAAAVVARISATVPAMGISNGAGAGCGGGGEDISDGGGLGRGRGAQESAKVQELSMVVAEARISAIVLVLGVVVVLRAKATVPELAVAVVPRISAMVPTLGVAVVLRVSATVLELAVVVVARISVTVQALAVAVVPRVSAMVLVLGVVVVLRAKTTVPELAMAVVARISVTVLELMWWWCQEDISDGA